MFCGEFFSNKWTFKVRKKYEFPSEGGKEWLKGGLGHIKPKFNFLNVSIFSGEMSVYVSICQYF